MVREKCLTAAQQHGRAMRARGINYRGGYTHEEVKAMREQRKQEAPSKAKDETIVGYRIDGEIHCVQCEPDPCNGVPIFSTNIFIGVPSCYKCGKQLID